MNRDRANKILTIDRLDRNVGHTGPRFNFRTKYLQFA